MALGGAALGPWAPERVSDKSPASGKESLVLPWLAGVTACTWEVQIG